MQSESSALTTFYQGWQRYQDHLAQAIARLTPDQLALRAAPRLRSIGTLAGHIVAARAYWFHNSLGEGGADIAAMTDWDEQDPVEQTAAELVAGLESTWQLMQNAVAGWTPAEFAAESFPRTWRGQEYKLSRQWVVWHLLEHDLHHGGEISLTLGMYGLEPPDV